MNLDVLKVRHCYPPQGRGQARAKLTLNTSQEHPTARPWLLWNLSTDEPCKHLGYPARWFSRSHLSISLKRAVG